MKLRPARRNDAIMAGLALAVIVLDQLTKFWVVQYFRVPGLRPPIPILGQVLELLYIQNTGVAFSLLEGQSVMFLFIAVAIVVIAVLYWRMRDTGSLVLKATFGLILGGAIGNLVDRFTRAYVVDFIHFQIPGRFDWPVFNVADSAISVGVVLLAFLLWRGTPRDASVPLQSAGPQAAAAERPGAPTALADASGGDVESSASGGSLTGQAPAAPRIRNPHARSR